MIEGGGIIRSWCHIYRSESLSQECTTSFMFSTALSQLSTINKVYIYAAFWHGIEIRRVYNQGKILWHSHLFTEQLINTSALSKLQESAEISAVRYTNLKGIVFGNM